MSKFIIQGGRKLNGKIKVAGNKNAILPIMAATLLVEGEVWLSNVPQIKDTETMTEILKSLGANAERIDSHMIRINTKNAKNWKIEPELAWRLRASVLFLGPLLARFGKAEIPHPGGDIIGKRNIDTHLEGLAGLGAKVTRKKSSYFLEKTGRMGKTVFLDEPSVTGTENIIMASVFAKEPVTVINAASEPHIVDLISFLQKAGAEIENFGLNSLKIRGVKKLKSVRHEIIPDHIEVGTFAVCAAVCGGEVDIYPAIADQVRIIILMLQRMGVHLKLEKNILTVYPSDLLAKAKKIQAGPWPLFPTDLMSPFIVLGTQAKGQTLFHDPMYESRMFFVDKLMQMGAQITICDPHRVIVYGPTKLHGHKLNSPDIRAGVALLIAALKAEGESMIENAEIIERGYETLEKRLADLGADIKKV